MKAINSTAWSAHEHTDRVEDKVTDLSQQILVFHDLLTRTTPISAPAQETVLEGNIFLVVQLFDFFKCFFHGNCWILRRAEI